MISLESDSDPPYLAGVRHIEDLFQEHGDSHKGLGYPKPDGYLDRYRIYFEVTQFGPKPPASIEILDIGCATGGLLDHIKHLERTDIRYRGVDLSELIVSTAAQKHPEADFLCADPLRDSRVWDRVVDYVILGGIFQVRFQMSQNEMTDYMLSMLRLAYSHARLGIVFNVMSKHVD